MSFPRYPKYKDSGVSWLGEFPADWAMARLGYESDTLVPMRDKPGDLGGEIPWIRIEDFDGKYISSSKSGQGVSEETVAAMNLKVLPVGSVLCSCSCNMGATAIVAQPLVTNQTFIGIVPGSGYVSEYLYYLFISATEYLNSIGTGAIQTYLSRDDFRRLRIPQPSLNEQQAIAAFLDREIAKIDALVAEQEKLIALLKEKRQAVISHAVTKGLDPTVPMKDSGIEWLGEVPAHWEVRKLSSISTKITNGFVGPTRDILVDKGVRYLQSLHIKGNRIHFDQPYFVREEWSNEHQKSILATGDVLIVQTGDIGQVACVTEEFAGCNCHALIIVAPLKSVVNGTWISCVLTADYGLHSLLSIQTGALHPHLNCGNVKDIYVPVPPLAEQSKIIASLIERLDAFDSLIAEAESAIGLLKERRSAMISAAVTGKIDVRGLADTH